MLCMTTGLVPCRRCSDRRMQWFPQNGRICYSSQERVLEDDGAPVPQLPEEWLNQRELQECRQQEANHQMRRNQVPVIARQDHPVVDNPVDDVPPAIPLELDSDSNDGGDVARNQPQNQGIGRPNRVRRQNPRYFGPDYVNAMDNFERDFGMLNDEESFIASLGFFDGSETSYQAQVMKALHDKKIDEDGILNGYNPLALMAKANANDSPNFHQAMNGPDSEGFYRAMQEEMESLESMDPWEMVPISVAKGKRILDSTWVFKRKRYPNGTVRKLKARWCVRGDH
jgi:hypothetical protein